MKLYYIEARQHTGRWKRLQHTYTTREQANDSIRSFDEDGFLSSSYRVVER